MKSKRVLYLSYDGMTDPLGQSQVLPYLVGLSKFGYEFTLLSFEKPGVYEEKKDRVVAICQEAGVHWIPLLYTKKPPILSTVKDVMAMKSVAERLHRKKPFDIVHCRSYIAAIVGLGLKKKTGVKFIFDMRGFWADERVDGGLWRLKNPLYKTVYRFFKKKERQFVQEADSIISLTHAGKAEIQNWNLHVPEITVIPCCVDTDLFDPKKENSGDLIRKHLRIPSTVPVIGYVGSLGTWYELPEMMDFFKCWQELNPESIFLFVTPEPKFLILEAARKAGINEQAIRITVCTRKEMPDHIAAMNYGLFFIKQAYSKKASSPVKQGELMAMGLPVICNTGVGDSDKIVENYNSGVLVKKYSSESYRLAAHQTLESCFNPLEIRQGAIAYFDLSKGIHAYKTVYQKLLAPILHETN